MNCGPPIADLGKKNRPDTGPGRGDYTRKVSKPTIRQTPCWRKQCAQCEELFEPIEPWHPPCRKCWCWGRLERLLRLTM
jgi:hypothetical protein